MVHLQVSAFASRHALRMDTREMLSGAEFAAQNVARAYHDSVCGKSAEFVALGERGAIDTRLHRSLTEEIAGILDADNDESDGCVKGAMQQREAMLNMRAAHMSSPAEIDGMHMIIGGLRDRFQGAGMHYAECGSHLTVVSDSADGLWRMDVQQQVLIERGCTVQLRIRFGDGQLAAGASSYLFEAAISSDIWNLDEGVDVEPYFTLVDMDGMLDGNPFWTTAVRVHPLSFIEQ